MILLFYIFCTYGEAYYYIHTSSKLDTLKVLRVLRVDISTVVTGKHSSYTFIFRDFHVYFDIITIKFYTVWCVFFLFSELSKK